MNLHNVCNHARAVCISAVLCLTCVMGFAYMPAVAMAETVKLVRDINRESMTYDHSNLSRVHANANRVFFLHRYGDDEKRLWSSDGKSASRVDFTPALNGRPYEILAVNRHFVYLSVANRDDGTSAIVRMPATGDGGRATEILEIKGTNDPYVRSYFAENGNLYFQVTVGRRHRVYRTINRGRDLSQLAGVDADPNSYPTFAALGNGLIYFNSSSYSGGTTSILRYEAGADRPKRVVTLERGAARVDQIQTGGDQQTIAYFQLEDRSGQCELWRTDGTAAGTLRILDTGIVIGDRETRCPNLLAQYNDRLFFERATESNQKELWVTDGSATKLRHIYAIGLDRYRFVGKLLGSELWVGANFRTADSRTGRLFRTDGTNVGTKLVAEAMNKQLLPQHRLGARMVYTVSGRSRFNPPGTMLYSADRATGEVKKLHQVRLLHGPSDAASISLRNRVLYFASRFRRGFSLFSHNAATGENRVVEQFGSSNRGSAIGYDQIQVSGGEAWFCSLVDTSLYWGNPQGAQIWRSDGERQGTHSIISNTGDAEPSDRAYAGAAYRTCGSFTVTPNEIFFTRFDRKYGKELWQSNLDGKDQKRAFIPSRQLMPGEDSSHPRDLHVVNNKVIMTALVEDRGGAHRRLVRRRSESKWSILSRALYDPRIIASTTNRALVIARDTRQSNSPLSSLYVTDGSTVELLAKGMRVSPRIVSAPDGSFFVDVDFLNRQSIYRLDPGSSQLRELPGLRARFLRMARPLIVYQDQLYFSHCFQRYCRFNEFDEHNAISRFDLNDNRLTRVWDDADVDISGAAVLANNLYWITSDLSLNSSYDSIGWTIRRMDGITANVTEVAQERVEHDDEVNVVESPSSMISDGNAIWFFAPKSGIGSELWQLTL